MIKFLKTIWWIFIDRCFCCGGVLFPHINGLEECFDCNLIQGSKK